MTPRRSLPILALLISLLLPPAAASAADNFQFFAPPAEGTLPDGPFGRLVRQGELIFTQTGKYAHPYVGNDLTCESCHLDRGIKPYSAPLWGAYGIYPKYRAKNHRVNTLEERIQGCFRFSMNGTAPPVDGKTMKALIAYSFWVSRGAPVGLYLKGQGLLRISRPSRAASPFRGKKIFEARCSLCHGLDGLGTTSDNDQTTFPPVWGPRSFNKGAGFHNVRLLAGFIKKNMPLSKGNTLTDQEAWDVASYIDSQPRPEDPRKRHG